MFVVLDMEVSVGKSVVMQRLDSFSGLFLDSDVTFSDSSSIPLISDFQRFAVTGRGILVYRSSVALVSRRRQSRRGLKWAADKNTRQERVDGDFAKSAYNDRLIMPFPMTLGVPTLVAKSTSKW